MGKYMVYFADIRRQMVYVSGRSIETVAKRFFGTNLNIVWDGDGYEILKINSKGKMYVVGHIEEKY